MRTLYFCKATTIALFALLSAGAVAAPSERPDPKAFAELQTAIAAYQKNDCASVTKIARHFLNRPPTDLPERWLSVGYDILISCEGRTSSQAARLDAHRATKLSEASEMAWQYRFYGDASSDNFADAVETLETMAVQRPRKAIDFNATPLRLYRWPSPA